LDSQKRELSRRVEESERKSLHGNDADAGCGFVEEMSNHHS
jgi:hypothetical protein